MESKLLSFAALLVCFSFVVGRPQDSPLTPAVALNEGCREGQLFNCATPVIAFFLSADGQRLIQLKDNRGRLEERDYNNVCRLGRTTIGCFNTWVEKCVPAEIAGVHVISKGAVKLLETCTEPDSFAKFTKLAACSEKMNATHKACGEQMKETHKNVNYRNPKVFLARDNLQQDVCCNLKKYNDCFLPKVESTCGAEGKEITDKFLQRVTDSFQCSGTVLSSCPTGNEAVTA